VAHWMGCYTGIVTLFRGPPQGARRTEEGQAECAHGNSATGGKEPRAGDWSSGDRDQRVRWEDFYQAAYWRLYAEYWT